MTKPSRQRRSRRASLIAPVLLLALIATVLVAGPAVGRSASVIGAKKNVPDPSCPGPKSNSFPSYKACNAFGHVTGFQIRTQERKGLYKAREGGKIVAWSVDLSKPRSDPKDPKADDERAFFESKLSDETFDRYGGNPVAGISVLKKVGRGRFKLTKKSPIVELDGALGKKPIYTLRDPIKVKKGRVIALTTPTWVTNFALAKPSGKAPLSNRNLWRASRRPNRCEGERRPDGTFDDRNLTKRSHPHVQKGTTKRYGCIYKGAQILYWAYFVPSEKKGE